MICLFVAPNVYTMLKNNVVLSRVALQVESSIKRLPARCFRRHVLHLFLKTRIKPFPRLTIKPSCSLLSHLWYAGLLGFDILDTFSLPPIIWAIIYPKASYWIRRWWLTRWCGTPLAHHHTTQKVDLPEEEKTTSLRSSPFQAQPLSIQSRIQTCCWLFSAV